MNMEHSLDTSMNTTTQSATVQDMELHEDGEAMQFLTFTLGNEEYGVDIMKVREVKGWTDTTRLPNAPAYVRGVLNLRGMILPIFDLRARFSGVLTQASPKHVIIMIAVAERIIGILADSVSDIITASTSQIKPAPEMESGDDAPFIDGLIALEERMVVLLDMEKLIHADIITHIDNTSPTVEQHAAELPQANDSIPQSSPQEAQ